MAAALAAGRGINSWAAKILAEQTGVAATGQTIANYVERYPALRDIAPAEKYRMLDYAEHNVVKSVEAGDMDTSRWLLRSQMANGRGYALPGQRQGPGRGQDRAPPRPTCTRRSRASDLTWTGSATTRGHQVAGVLGAVRTPEGDQS